MRISVTAASVGVLKDVDGEQQPVAGLTDMRGVRFVDAKIQRFGHDRKLRDLDQSPFYLLGARSENNYFWIVGGSTSIYSLRGTSLTNISRTVGGPYVFGGRWNGGVFNGLPILNNYQNVPQFLQTPGIGNRFENLPNWPGTHRAKIMRPFLNVLVALGLKVGAVEQPYTIKTSHPADPGTVPLSWDSTDPTKDVFEVAVADTPDYIVDGLVLRTSFVIYKEKTVWVLTPNAGGNSLFRLDRLFDNVGLLAPDCVCQLDGGRHFVVTSDDVIVHNGSSFESIIDGKNRHWLFDTINKATYTSAFVLPVRKFKEIWICFPKDVGLDADIALVWDWLNNRWHIRELPGIRFLAEGVNESADDDNSWDASSGSWNQDITAWDDFSDPRLLSGLLAAKDKELWVLDSRFLGDVGSESAYIERLDFPFGVYTGNGQLLPAYENIKEYKFLWPRIRAPKGLKFLFTPGGRDSLDDPIVWGSPRVYTTGRDKFVELWTRARYLSLRISCDAVQEWSMTGYDLEYELLGRF